MALQRKDVVAKALEILQHDGIDGLTLRKLAAELHIQAASLYTHVKSKRDLLDEMTEEMLHAQFPTMPEPEKGEAWQTWFKNIIHRVRTALLTYRDGGLVAAGVNLRRAKTYAQLNAYMVSVFCETYGFDFFTALKLVSTALLYTYGSVIEEQHSPGMEEMQKTSSAAADYFSPEMKQKLAVAVQEIKQDTRNFFDQSLELMIRGVGG